MTWSKADYERLGDYVTAARLRAEMDRNALAAAAGISVRTLADIENADLGKRRAFSPETLEAIGLHVGWGPGSWRRVLNGGEPELAEPRKSDSTVQPSPTDAERDRAALMTALQWLGPDELMSVAVLIRTYAERRGAKLDKESTARLNRMVHSPAPEPLSNGLFFDASSVRSLAEVLDEIHERGIDIGVHVRGDAATEAGPPLESALARLLGESGTASGSGSRRKSKGPELHHPDIEVELDLVPAARTGSSQGRFAREAQDDEATASQEVPEGAQS